jgi:hypothetical protein
VAEVTGAARDEAVAQRSGSSTLRRIVRWMFVNRRTGGLTIAQWPNFALSLFIALSIAQRFNFPAGAQPEITLRLLSVVALVIWAADELFRGVILSARFSARVYYWQL